MAERQLLNATITALGTRPWALLPAHAPPAEPTARGRHRSLRLHVCPTCLHQDLSSLLHRLGSLNRPCAPCSELHENFPVVPGPIRAYIEEVKQHLETITMHEGPALSIQDKLSFLRETRHAFGRTALVLSGGGALGAFHVVRAADV